MVNQSVFFIMVCGIGLGVSILCCVLLRKLFKFYRNRYFLGGFWLINILSLIGARLVQKDMIPTTMASYVVEVAVLWFMGQLFLVLLLPIGLILKKIYCSMNKQSTVVSADLDRRAFIKGLALSLPTAAMGISCYGSFRASKDVRLLQHDIAVRNLPMNFEGFKIGHLTDTHVGLFFSVDKLRECMERLADKQVDVVVITGDLIDDIAAISGVVEVLNYCSAKFPHGIYFSWGNHEYFRDFDTIETALSASRMKILRNENDVLYKGNDRLYLLGVDYPWAKDAKDQEEECKQMLDRASEGVVKGDVKVLLSHHPAFIDVAYDYDIDLSLVGHTHGGQVAIFGQAILPVRYKYMRGMYFRDKQYAYVSTGAGSWFPFRLGCPAEITIFKLKKSLSY